MRTARGRRARGRRERTDKPDCVRGRASAASRRHGGARNRMFPNFYRQAFVHLCGKQLVITQAADAVVRLEDYSRSYDRAEERASSNLVNARDQLSATTPGILLELQSALEPLEQAQL